MKFLKIIGIGLKYLKYISCYKKGLDSVFKNKKRLIIMCPGPSVMEKIKENKGLIESSTTVGVNSFILSDFEADAYFMEFKSDIELNRINQSSDKREIVFASFNRNKSKIFIPESSENYLSGRSDFCLKLDHYFYLLVPLIFRSKFLIILYFYIIYMISLLTYKLPTLIMYGDYTVSRILACCFILNVKEVVIVGMDNTNDYFWNVSPKSEIKEHPILENKNIIPPEELISIISSLWRPFAGSMKITVL
jgi:hypothetical protein